MKNYSKEEKDIILIDIKRGFKPVEIVKKYNIHLSTYYSWKSKLDSNSKNRNISIQVKFNKKEYEKFIKRATQLGYNNNLSAYVRMAMINKDVVLVNPHLMNDENYKLRAELNKIGSNINQMANYTNFLKANNYVENTALKDINDSIETASTLFKNWKSELDKFMLKFDV